MKIIIVGATGFIGGEALRQALLNSSIASVVALTRRDLAESTSQNPKLKVVKLQDFESYSVAILKALEGAELCIWTMGGRVSQSPDLATSRKSNVDYTIAGAEAFATHLAPILGQSKKFRFIYCSGAFTERDLQKKLYFLQDSRHLKGEAENGLLDVEKRNSDKFEIYIARPAGVLPTNNGLQNMLMGPLAIGVEELGAVLLDMAFHGADTQVTENSVLRVRGRMLLDNKSK